jgi:hypothetical protein
MTHIRHDFATDAYAAVWHAVCTPWLGAEERRLIERLAA